MRGPAVHGQGKRADVMNARPSGRFAPGRDDGRMWVSRTPEERFTRLPGFYYPARYADVGGIRMGYVTAGPPDGPVVLLLHGEPSWSFLYRTVMAVLAARGLRAIAPDLIGFGRSDKPARAADHSYARHVEWVRTLAFDRLDLRDVTLAGQDWGGLIGLRLVAEHPDRFARVVAAKHRPADRRRADARGVVAVPPGRGAGREARRGAAGAGGLPDEAARSRCGRRTRRRSRTSASWPAPRDADPGADRAG